MSEACGVCETRMHQISIRETTLEGQRALVTGANSGIGEAIARGHCPETVRSFRELIEGEHDDLPESAFLLKGSIDQVVEAAKK